VQILEWQQQQKEDVLRKLAGFRGKGLLPKAFARRLQDVLMACILFGHSSLALRQQVLVVAKSSNAELGCEEPGCPAVECNGTRFERKQRKGGGSKWVLAVPHHKVSDSIGGQVLPITDKGVKQLLEAHEDRGRPVLADSDVEQMFVNDDGEPYHPKQIASWWKKLHK
jgi:hypothetical protein